jgi:hypothetical protein
VRAVNSSDGYGAASESNAKFRLRPPSFNYGVSVNDATLQLLASTAVELPSFEADGA